MIVGHSADSWDNCIMFRNWDRNAILYHATYFKISSIYEIWNELHDKRFASLTSMDTVSNLILYIHFFYRQLGCFRVSQNALNLPDSLAGLNPGSFWYQIIFMNFSRILGIRKLVRSKFQICIGFRQKMYRKIAKNAKPQFSAIKFLI